MKILIILPRFHTNYFGVIKTLKNHGYDVKLNVFNYGKTENYSNIKPIYIPENVVTKFLNFLFKPKLNKFYLPNFKNYTKFISDFKPDIVIIRPYNKVFSFYILLLRLIYNFQLIFYVQTNEDKLKNFNFSFKFLQFFFINYILKIKIYSPIIQNVKKLFFKRIYFIPFVSKISFKKKSSKKNRFLMIGKFVKKKNYEMFIKSLKILNKTNEIEGTIVGEVSTKEHYKEYVKIKKLIKINNLERQIKIYKNINHKNIANFYHLNDFFVLPTSGDLAPITIVEALGFGCMVLCSSSCGTKNYIRKNFNGYVFVHGDQKSLNKYMIKLIRNKKKFKSNLFKNKIIAENLIGEKNFLKKFNSMVFDK
jgi:glycosyltransferase involved in cell wall biosynthesis